MAGWQKPFIGARLNRTHPLAKGLVGCWIMNEGGGNTVYDLAQSIEGTFGNSPEWKNGDILFASDDHDYISMARNPMGGGNNNFTLFAVVVPNSNPSYYFGVVTLGTGSPGNCGYVGQAGNGNWGCGFWGSNHQGNTPLVVGKTTSVATTYNAGSSTQKLYVDGMFDSTFAESGSSLPSNIGFIGAIYQDNYFFDGYIKLSYVYNRVLSSPEIAWLHREPYAMFEQETPVWTLYSAGGGATTYTKTSDIDALLKKTGIIQTQSLDALLLQTLSVNVSIDSLLSELKTNILNIDSILKNYGVIRTSDLDSILQQLDVQQIVSLDSLLQSSNLTTSQLDSLLQKSMKEDVSIDALLQKTGINNTTLDSLLQKLQLKYVSVDGILQKVYTKEITIDALLQALNIRTVSIDALLKATNYSITTIDALLKKSHIVSISIDSLLQHLGITSSVSIDSILKQYGISVTSDLDAILVESGTSTVTTSIDALLKKYNINFYCNIDAMLQNAGITLNANFDAMLAKELNVTASIDSLLSANILKSLSLDSMLQQGKSKSVYINALLSRLHSITANIDAIIASAVPSVTVNLDSLIQETQTVLQTLDAILISSTRYPRYDITGVARTLSIIGDARMLSLTGKNRNESL